MVSDLTNLGIVARSVNSVKDGSMNRRVFACIVLVGGAISISASSCGGDDSNQLDGSLDGNVDSTLPDGGVDSPFNNDGGGSDAAERRRARRLELLEQLQRRRASHLLEPRVDVHAEQRVLLGQLPEQRVSASNLHQRQQGLHR